MQKTTVAVMLSIFIASFRVRQMILSGYIINGAHFQLADFALTVFCGFAWIHKNLIDISIHLIILVLTGKMLTMYLAMKNLKELFEWGLFQFKYFPELRRLLSEKTVVMIEITLDVALLVLLMKCLEVVEAEMLDGSDDGEEEGGEEEVMDKLGCKCALLD